jgi:hypothetical protein
MTLSPGPEFLDPHHHPCPCVQHHEPQLHRTQGHHVLPQYAGGQAKHPDKEGFTEIQALCPTGHDIVHMLLEEWAQAEAEHLRLIPELVDPAVNPYEPPVTSRTNHVLHVIALRGWREFKKYWPDRQFPRLGGSEAA